MALWYCEYCPVLLRPELSGLVKAVMGDPSEFDMDDGVIGGLGDMGMSDLELQHQEHTS